MDHVNIEIKARCNSQDYVRKILINNGARYVGLDHQIDTYFRCNTGRLKLREGNIENSLIHYNRENQTGPKQSNVAIFRFDCDLGLKDVLTSALDTLVVVDKKREIYFIDNVKFHLDDVKNLGTFVEIEAIDEYLTLGTDKLLLQCKHYSGLFGIRDSDLISESYSDLLFK